MNKLCCVLNKSIHSNWKGVTAYYCTQCIQDLLEKEYGTLFKKSKYDKDGALGEQLRKDFKYLHPIRECIKWTGEPGHD